MKSAEKNTLKQNILVKNTPYLKVTHTDPYKTPWNIDVPHFSGIFGAVFMIPHVLGKDGSRLDRTGYGILTLIISLLRAKKCT